MNDPVISGLPASQELLQQTQHVLQQWPVGSRNDANAAPAGRRFQSVCRHCPNVNQDGKRNSSRDTSYYCSCCMVGLHPQCFHEFHHGKPESYRAPRPLKTRRVPNLEPQLQNQIS
jgi:hypothetical protein